MKGTMILFIIFSLSFMSCRPDMDATEYNIADKLEELNDESEKALDNISPEISEEIAEDVMQDPVETEQKSADAPKPEDYPEACYDIYNYDLNDATSAQALAGIDESELCKFSKPACKDPNASNYVKEDYEMQEFVDKEALLNGELRKFQRQVHYSEDNSLCNAYCGYKFQPVENYESFSCDSSIKKTIIIGVSADDAAKVYINGKEVLDHYDWKKWSEVKVEIDNCGVVGFMAYDKHQVVSGMLSIIWDVDENGNKKNVIWTSGQSDLIKVFGPQHPTPGNLDWASKEFDHNSSGWRDALKCNARAVRKWGSAHQDKRNLGAAWLWHNSDCNDLKQAYFRFKYVFDAPKTQDPGCHTNPDSM